MIAYGDDPVSQRLRTVGQEFGHGLALDLSRIRAVLAALGDPQRRLPPIFHVAGTNGKGSTCAFLRAIYEAADLKAHVFTSPHLVKPNERVRVAGALASDGALIDAIDRVAATGLAITYFEAITAAAFLLFAETDADATILEVGLGGRFDATNVIDRPLVSVIAPIGLDHTAILGDTLAKIAFEKAGVLRRGVPAVIARQGDEAREAIEAEIERVGALPIRYGAEWDCRRAGGRLIVETHDRLVDLPPPSLFGPHQFDNAGLAVAAALAAEDPRLTDDVLARGVSSAVWPARLQRLTKGPLAALCAAKGGELWLDGAHNPHGAEALAAALAELDARSPRPLVLVVGILTTKDAESMLKPLRARADRLIAAPFASKSARDPAELTAAAASLGFDARAGASIEDAVTLALGAASAPHVLICGSLYLAGEVLAMSGGVE